MTNAILLYKKLLIVGLAVSAGLTAHAGRSYYKYTMSENETFELALDNITNTHYVASGGDRGHQFEAAANCTVKFLPGANPGGTAKIYLSFLPVAGELKLDFSALTAYDNVHLIGSVRADRTVRDTPAGLERLGSIKIIGRDELIVGSEVRGNEIAINYPFLHTAIAFEAAEPKGIVLTNDVTILSNPDCPMRFADGARVVPFMNNPFGFEDTATIEGLNYDLYLVNKTSVPTDATIKVGAGRALYFRPVGVQNYYEWYGVGQYGIGQSIVLDDETARFVMANSSTECSIGGTVSGTGRLDAWGTGELIFKGETTFRGPVVWENNAKLFFTGTSAGDPSNALTMKKSGSRLHLRPSGYGLAPTTGTVADLTGTDGNARIHVYNNQTITIGTARGSFGFESDSATGRVVIENLEAGATVNLQAGLELEILNLGTGVTINLEETADGFKSWGVKGPTSGEPIDLTLKTAVTEGGSLTLGGKINVGRLDGISTVKIVGSDKVGFSVNSGTRVDGQNAQMDLDLADESGWQNKVAIWADATVNDSLVYVTNVFGTSLKYPATVTVGDATYDQIIAWRDRRSSQKTCEFRNIRFTSAAAWDKASSSTTVCPFAYTNAINGKTVVSFNGTSRHLRLMRYNSTATRHVLHVQHAIVVFGSQLGGGSALFATTNNAFGRSGYNQKNLLDGLKYPMTTGSWNGYVDGVATNFSQAYFNGGWQILSLDTQGERICGLGYSTADTTTGVTDDSNPTPKDRGQVLFAEVMLFSEKPTDRERRAAEEYLSAKWGIPLGGQPNEYRLTLSGDGELKLQRDLAVEGRFNGTVDLNGHELALPAARRPYTEAEIPTTGRVLWMDPSLEGAVVMSDDVEKPLEVRNVLVRDAAGVRTVAGALTLTSPIKDAADRRPVKRTNPRTNGRANTWIDFTDWYGDARGNTLILRSLPLETVPEDFTGALYRMFQTAFIVSDSSCGGGTPISDRAHADLAIKARPSQTAMSWSSPIWAAGSSNYVLQASTWLDGRAVDGATEGFGGKPEVFSFAAQDTQMEFRTLGYYGNDSAAHPNREMIGEVLLYNGVLEPAVREGIQAYLMDKWLGRLPEGFADFRNLTVTGSGTVKAASVADLPQFADAFAGTIALTGIRSFGIRVEGGATQVDGALVTSGPIELPNPCTVDLTVGRRVPSGDYTLLSGAGFAEGQAFELGTCDVPDGKRVKLVVSGGVLKAQVTSAGLVIFAR